MDGRTWGRVGGVGGRVGSYDTIVGLAGVMDRDTTANAVAEQAGQPRRHGQAAQIVPRDGHHGVRLLISLILWRCFLITRTVERLLFHGRHDGVSHDREGRRGTSLAS